ncbi:MAG TPA: 4-(cytidine 5'-diphospho)-2-C-methyl-D-erythritol kinase, partial [Firmicutes bacterium]|nr:4-(cytidine 5'-diphospho)-2-C-methyl-D-erythritol kinase [Bacillota bacterium]
MGEKLLLRGAAKINVGLTVLEKRDDGYHNLESVMQQISLADSLLFEPAESDGWQLSCTEAGLSGPHNLVCQAAELLCSRYGRRQRGVKITLFKNIPVEAGLAGGSSDAAAALLGLNRFWEMGLDRRELLNCAAILGSDVPFCLQGGTALVRGRGETVEKLPDLPFHWVVLALPPRAGVSAAAAYQAFDRGYLGKPDLSPLLGAVRSGSREGLQKWMAEELTNTLETASLPGLQRAGLLKKQLQSYGLIPALSGSGPALFMLFDHYYTAGAAARAVENTGARSYLCWT